MNVGREVIRAQGASSGAEYRKRVTRLARIYPVTVRNPGHGDGEVQVSASLSSPSSGEVLAAGSVTAQVGGHQTVTVAIELHPPSVGPFVEEADVRYPP